MQNVADWHRMYKDRLIQRLACTEEQAEDILQAGMDDIDYLDSPIDAADEEVSYWGD